MAQLSQDKLLNLARIINRFRLSSDPSHMYGQLIQNYDLLLELIENEHNIIKLALLTEMPLSKVRQSLYTMVDSLLFNKNKDPYISLGLKGIEDNSIVTKRWRHLIILFHPDRYPGSNIYEERAKRVNEAYEEIRKSGIKKTECVKIYARQSNTVKYTVPTRQHIKINQVSNSNNHFFLIKYIPFIIIIVMLSISVISLYLLIKRF